MTPGDAQARANALTADPELSAAIANYLGNGDVRRALTFDALWFGTPPYTTGMARLALSDPHAVAVELNRNAWRSDLARRTENRWPQDLNTMPLGDLNVTLVTADGRTFPFGPGLSNRGMPVWAEGFVQYAYEGANVRIHSAYVVEGGQVIEAPDIIMPVAGGDRTVTLPGGGRLNLVLDPSPLTPEQIAAWIAP